MEGLSLVYPFYMNQGMLREQYKTWVAYPDDLKAKIEVVIVDDGSPENERAIDVARPSGLPELQIYRVLIDKPWNQHGARNLGAKMAKGPWLLLTDMDHVVPVDTLLRLFSMVKLNVKTAYTFQRLIAPTLEPKMRNGEPHPHPNSFLMTKELYWKVGGYDESYCGIYGTDGYFRRRLTDRAKRRHFADVPLVLYSREVLADASTRTLPRKEGRDPNAKRNMMLSKVGHKIATITFPWERQL